MRYRCFLVVYEGACNHWYRCFLVICERLQYRRACCALLQQVAGRGAVQGVQIRGADSEGWQAMNNLWGAAWETGTVPKAPLDFRIQDDNGNDVSCHRKYPHELHCTHAARKAALHDWSLPTATA